MSGENTAGTCNCSCGRCASALATAATRACAAGSSVALPGGKSMRFTFAPPPNMRPSMAKGAVTAFSSTLISAMPMSGPRLNCGSLRLPVTGSPMRMTPLRSLSRATASRRGSLVACGLGDLIAELQLIDDELVIGIELAVVQLVVQVGIERAARDLVAREAHRIGSHAGELESAERHLDVAVGRGGEEIHHAADVDRGITIHPALQLDRGARARVGRQALDRAVQILDAGREVGLHREIGVIGRAVGDAHQADGHRHRCGVGARLLACRRQRPACAALHWRCPCADPARMQRFRSR